MTDLTNVHQFLNPCPLTADKIRLGKRMFFIHPQLDDVLGGDVQYVCSDSETVRITDTRVGDVDISLDQLFQYEGDAKTLLYQYHYEIGQTYKAQITDVNSLVRFMYTHPVAIVSEQTDYDARLAARLAAKELLGIDL